MAWLAAVVLTGSLGHRMPTWAMVTGTLVGSAWNSFVAGWVTAVVSLAAAGGIFLLFALTGLVSRSTTVAVIPTLASLPVFGWVALVPGLLCVAAVSAVRLRKVAGQGYLRMVAGETYAAMGQGTSHPDLSRLPLPRETSELGAVKVHLAACLLGSVMVVCSISLYAG